MRYFAFLDEAGRVKSTISSVRLPGSGIELPANGIEVTEEQFAQLSSEPGWLYVDSAWVAPAPRVPPLNKRAFLRLFTQAEFLAILAARDSGDNDVKYFWAMMEADSTVDLQHPSTIAGLSLLVQKTLLTQLRATQILAGQPPA